MFSIFKLVSLLMVLEGYSSTAYQDVASVWTIGYGRTENVQRNDTSNKFIESLWLAERARNELSWVRAHEKHCGYSWSDSQRIALASFRYNIGNLNQLTRNCNRTEVEIGEAMLLYNKANGNVVQGLVNRRNREYEIYKGLD